MNTKGKLILGICGLAILSACTSKRPLATVKEVDLDKYAGKWYDIAHLPQRFQKDCKCVTAEYTPADGYVIVHNTCVDKNSGKAKGIKGKAFPKKNDDSNSKLRVQFFWPFRGDYYIIALKDDYSYALVGGPDRKSLWILSRTPKAAAMVVKEYLNKAEELGFDTSKMVYTDQSCYTESD